MTSNLTWKHLSLKQIEAYTKLPDPASRLKFLSKTFPVSPEPERAGIELDLYFYVLQFGIERAFTPDKISVLFSIFKQTHAESMRLFWPAKQAFSYFRDLVLQHSVQRPPYSVGLFSLEHVQAITDFASTGYFRHYLLYKYAFTKKTEMEFATVYTHTLEVAEGFLMPLDEGEDEDANLKREEDQALALLESAHKEVTVDELEAAGVPEDIREEVLRQVNEKLESVKDGMQSTLDKTHAEMQARIAELEAQLKQKGN
ncbi:flagellar C1a complex subunit C1a-32-domain-containing protein [Baffinella frigidus]|nr:flagellar C1a complex subunit C1a-32-domain-containing protein [Cryptophyta sp. CCMP2293]|mmetsp:Transcript_31328/g.74449  ORF Transcript_31328/g.74449 Transcript_31328/m.74449 type:complete len:257 (-) Transcript_31328:168-938(-)